MALIGYKPLVAKLVKEAGFNCVQFPVSVELVKSNRLGSALDEAIQELSDRQIMVVVGIHVLKAGWCCSYSDGNGIWNLAGDSEYTTAAWVDALQRVVQRYKNNPWVIGVDLFNEIHNTPGRAVSWGANDNVDLDWKAASEHAAEKVHMVNNESLVFVQGMCYALDLRPLHKAPPLFRLSSSKLVLVGHFYPWSFFWSIIQHEFSVDRWAPFIAILAISCAISMWKMQKTGEAHPGLICMQIVVLGVVISTIGASLLYSISASIGCANPDVAVIVAALCLISGVGIFFYILMCAYSQTPAKAHAAAFLYSTSAITGVWACIVFPLTVSQPFRTAMLQQDVQRYLGTHQSKHPFFLGEFGMAINIDEDRSDYWAVLKRLHIRNWAYWPLNSLKYNEKSKTFTDETYGLLRLPDYKWATTRLQRLPW